jgi:hypothetical protein
MLSILSAEFLVYYTGVVTRARWSELGYDFDAHLRFHWDTLVRVPTLYTAIRWENSFTAGCYLMKIYYLLFYSCVPMSTPTYSNSQFIWMDALLLTFEFRIQYTVRHLSYIIEEVWDINIAIARSCYKYNVTCNTAFILKPDLDGSTAHYIVSINAQQVTLQLPLVLFLLLSSVALVASLFFFPFFLATASATSCSNDMECPFVRYFFYRLEDAS